MNALSIQSKRMPSKPTPRRGNEKLKSLIVGKFWVGSYGLML